ncbi:uncharacterized protein [Palaemon carinicauda]|uniref:uncharacterized protein n=1 Tax=Palaemon carinicauda TaxID=392227 RepID=UPI0035B60198
MDPKIKWWKLKEEELRVLFKERVLEADRLHEDIQKWWTENSKVILRMGEEVLGKSSGKRPPHGKESWWWNDEVQEQDRCETSNDAWSEDVGNKEDRREEKGCGRDENVEMHVWDDKKR